MPDDVPESGELKGAPQSKRVEPLKEGETPYELAPEPEPEAWVAPPGVEPVRGVEAHAAPGRLSDRGLMDDLPEDADLEHDPEVERALKGGGETGTVDADDEVERKKLHRLVKGPGDPRVLGMIGGVIAVAAGVVAGWRHETHWFYAGVMAVYLTALHTLTGMAAIGAVAYLQRMRFGKVGLGLARMLIAVALGALVMSLGTGGANAITAPLGVVVYLAALAVLFRWSPVTVARVGAVHAVLIVMLYAAMILFAASKAPA